MTTPPVSRRQKRILRVRVAEHRRPQGGTSLRHYALVKALEGDKGQISHRLRTLASKGWIVIDRTPGGRADYLDRTPEGLEKAAEI
jgi:DNA-binding MarR family transcriptional regulator